jgi:hypothetical protein
MLPLIILALSLAVPALTRPAAGIAQRFLCERSYLNFAWGYQHFGIYVDRDGDVYRFRIGPGGYRKHPSGPTLTEKELDDKYGDKRTRVRTLSADEVRAMLALIPAAAKGQFSTKVSRSSGRARVTSSILRTRRIARSNSMSRGTGPIAISLRKQHSCTPGCRRWRRTRRRRRQHANDNRRLPTLARPRTHCRPRLRRLQ